VICTVRGGVSYMIELAFSSMICFVTNLRMMLLSLDQTFLPVSCSIIATSRGISLPLGNLLHLAYNPGYTGSDEARSLLLQHLADESKAGGRARCWNCGSIAIAYDRWNTRSKTFGEVGVAFCEICGVWSVM